MIGNGHCDLVYLQVCYLSVCRCVYQATALSRETWVQACPVCEHLCPGRCSSRESQLLTQTRTSFGGASLPAPLAGASLKKKEKNTHIIHDKYCNRPIWEYEGFISKPDRNRWCVIWNIIFWEPALHSAHAESDWVLMENVGTAQTSPSTSSREQRTKLPLTQLNRGLC